MTQQLITDKTEIAISPGVVCVGVLYFRFTLKFIRFFIFMGYYFAHSFGETRLVGRAAHSDHAKSFPQGIRRKKMTRSMNVAALLLGGLLLPAVASATTITIDSFSQVDPSNPNPSSINSNGVINNFTNPTAFSTTNTIGGYRQVIHSVTAGADPLSDTRSRATVFTTPGNSRLSLSNDDGVDSIISLIYDANGAGFNSGLGLDLTNGGTNDRVQVVFLTSDALSSTKVILTDADGSAYSQSLASTAGPNTKNFLYSNFSTLLSAGSTAGLDLNTITSITFEIDAAVSADYSIKLISTGSEIPEPSSAALALMGLGAVVMGVRRRA